MPWPHTVTLRIYLKNKRHMNQHTENTLPDLRTLRPPITLVRISGFLTRLFEVYFITVVISLFLGFLNMFPFDEFGDMAFAKIIRGFMYFVLTLVVLMITNKRIKIYLGEKSPELVKNNLRVGILTVLFSAVVIAASWFIGTRFLGSDFGFNFFLKWGGGILSVFVLILPYNALKLLELKFNANYKNLILNQFLSANKNISWQNKEFLPQDDFTDSKLFNYQTIWNYTGSDLFQQKEFNFRGSRLIVHQREVNSSAGKTEVKITEIFNGYLFIADFNKAFQHHTFIVPDTGRQVLGEVYGEMVNEWIKRGGAKLVQFEDVNFEQKFSVYSTDELEARYLLSTKLIERITQFSDHFYQAISISFCNNKIYIAVATEKDILTPHIYGKIDDPVFLEKQISQLNALLTLPEQLDLKTKIWAN